MRARLVTVVLLFAQLLLGQQPAPAPAAEKPKFELETFYMAVMRNVAGKTLDPAAIQKLAPQHGKHWQALADKGGLVLAGPIADKQIAAVLVFRAANKDEAGVIASQDAFVQGGYWTPTIHRWMTQKGVLPGIKKLNPSDTCFLGFLRRPPNAPKYDEAKSQEIQQAHLANMRRLAEMGKLVAAGPFAEDTDLRGIFVFKTATLEEANELTNTDPAVKAGRLKIELYPWTLPPDIFALK